MRQEGNLFLDPFTFFALFTATRYPAVVKSFIVYLSLAISILFVTACQVAPLAGSSSTAPSAQPMSATEFPSLDDFWDGRATFVVDVVDTGLPMGESDTVVVGDKLWSYLHASYQSAGVVDQCGDPVAFPGCVVLMQSDDGGRTFATTSGSAAAPVCQIPCLACPCDSKRDQIDQQQYPRLTHSESAGWLMVYEYRANSMLRRSSDGIHWSPAEEVPLTGIWQKWLMPCAAYESVGEHPFASREYDCLVGSPPGITLLDDTLYLFVGLGQNPGHMGCFVGEPNAPASLLRKCSANPLFGGATSYGDTALANASMNAHFDFRTISSADTLQVGNRTYLFYEGVRGPTPNAAGDTQFALGLARTVTDKIDGKWERYPGNPILVDLPGNVGVGHGDVLLYQGETYLYTTLDGKVRSRLKLVWQ